MFYHAHIDSTDSGIHIEAVAPDAPEMERVYTAKLDERATIKIRMKVFLNSMFQDGELTQPNGRWVYFDPNAIADKILDPVLVPKVQACVDEIHALDKAYRDSKPSDYTDKQGVIWRRQN